MVSEENTVDPLYVNTDPTHQEGIAHIKDKLYERNGAPTNIAPGGSGISQQQPGLIDSVKSYLGYGASSDTTTGTAADQSTSSSAEPHPADTLAPKTTEADKVNADVSKTTNADDSATGAKSDPSDADQEDTSAPSNPTQHTEPKPADPKTMEHRDAIPTAGGVRLGEKHWGESDIVPELPPKDTSGQSSADVQANTAKNTGSATAPATGTATGEQQHSKPSVLDKIKDKLPGHNKD